MTRRTGVLLGAFSVVLSAVGDAGCESRDCMRSRVCHIDFRPGTLETDAVRFYSNTQRTEFECSSMITVTNNIVVDTQDCSHFEQYSARSNLVANNVFLQHRTRGVPFSLPTPTATARPCDLRHNLAVWNKSRLFYAGGADRKIFRFADNLMWSLDPKRPCPAEEGFKRLDPCLKLPVGPELGFTDETNVRSVGFVPFSLVGVGKRTPDELTRGLPPVPDVFFPVPVKEMRENGLSIDFEDTPPGARHKKLWPYPDNAESARSVFVTEETA